MTTMPMQISPLSTFVTAIRDLLGLGGYGTVEYTVGAAGDLVHARTVATVKPTPAERADLDLFLSRLRDDHDLRPADTLELRYQSGKLETAVITRRPAGS